MRSPIARSVTMFFALFLTLALGSVTAAQDATPQGESPDADECTYEPRTVEEMQALHGTPAPSGAGEATSIVQASPVDFVLPEGEPADAETVAAITTEVRAGIACFNAGDYLASFGGVTDEFIEQHVGVALFDEDFVAAMNAEPVPLPEDQQTVLIGIDAIIVLEDGRVAAVVHYQGPSSPGEGIDGVETDLWTYENVDGQWLQDESIENIEATHGPDIIATPAA